MSEVKKCIRCEHESYPGGDWCDTTAQALECKCGAILAIIDHPIAYLDDDGKPMELPVVEVGDEVICHNCGSKVIVKHKDSWTELCCDGECVFEVKDGNQG